MAFCRPCGDRRADSRENLLERSCAMGKVGCLLHGAGGPACVCGCFRDPAATASHYTDEQSQHQRRTKWPCKCPLNGGIGGMASRDAIQRMSATIHDGCMGVAHNQGSRQRAIGTISMADLQLSYLPE
jgi:hypothetical protein